MSKKEVILRAAMWLFSEKGFKDTSMIELSKMTGAAEGTIFYHFKNKEDLFLSTLESVKNEIIDQFEHYFRETMFETGLHMIEGAILFYLNLAGAMGDQFLLLHRHDAYEIAKANSTCREHLEAVYNCLLDIFERAIVRGQQDGSIRSVSPRKTALIIFSMVDGLVRIETYNLYHAGSLYEQLKDLCRRMLQNGKPLE
jgi:AcrR family transcriptional regulator